MNASPAPLLRAVLLGAALATTVSISHGAPPVAGPTQLTAEEQNFGGTVSCSLRSGSETREATWDTRIAFDWAIGPTWRRSSLPRVGWQLGGLAEAQALTEPVRLDVRPAPHPIGRELEFEASVHGDSGRYRERGRWRVGADAEGSPTLTGESAVTLYASADRDAKPWQGICNWNLAPLTGPAGPLSLKVMGAHFDTATASGKSGASTAKSTSCGAMMSATSDGLYIASAMFSFITPVSAILSVGGVTTAIVGGSAGSACLSSQIDNMNQQLNAQAKAIMDIETTMGLAAMEIYQAAYKQNVDNQGTAAYIWKKSNLDMLATTSSDNTYGGLFGTFMGKNKGIGLWDEITSTPPTPVPNVTTQGIAEHIPTTNTDDWFGHAVTQAEANSSVFQAYLRQLSGTVATCPTGTTCTTDMYKWVAQDPTSALVLLYRESLTTLKSKVNLYMPAADPSNAVTHQNIVPLFDQHNATLVSFYQQALQGLQQAFTMEWLVNQLNFHRGHSGPDKTQIPKWGLEPGTYYNYNYLGTAPSLNQQQQAYNQAQKQLVYLYAAKANQLYLNTLNYLVTDFPMAPQAFPTTIPTFTFNGKTYTEKKVDYFTQLGRSIPAIWNYGGRVGDHNPQEPINLVPAAAGLSGDWGLSTVLYQFPGLYDAAKCVNNLLAYNQRTGATGGSMADWQAQVAANPDLCPAIFTLADKKTGLTQGYYDGNTLAPYTTCIPKIPAGTGTSCGVLVQAGKLVNNLKFCDASQPMVGYYAPSGSFVGNAAGLQAGAVYLNCGNWYVPAQADPCQHFPNASCIQGTNALRVGATSSTDYNTATPYADWITPSGSVGADNNGYSTPAGYPASLGWRGLWQVSTKGDLGCNMKIKGPSGANYSLLTTFTDSLPLFMQQQYCGVVKTATNSLSGAQISPVFAGLKIMGVNGATLENGGGAYGGCTVGFALPGSSGYIVGWKDDGGIGPNRAIFGMQMPNANPYFGGRSDMGGWILPLQMAVGCDDLKSVGDAQLVASKGSMADRGFVCTGESSQIRCTILDGTQYLLKQRYPSDSHTYVDITVVTP